MKIVIQESGSRKLTLRLPTRLILCPALLSWGLKIGRRYSDSVPDISRRSFRELKRILLDAKRREKGWVLVDVQSSDGDSVKITL